MNWQIVSALGELFGGLAVVLSLLYLAHQVRESRMQATAEGQRDVLNTAHLHIPVATTPGATSDWRKGLNHYESLDPDTQARFHHLIHPHINHVEAVFHMYNQGLMDEDTYERWMAGIIGIITTEGGKSWWKHVRSTFGPKYVAELEKKRDSSDKVYKLTEHWHFYNEDSLGNSP
jgi:hypothetical protein